MPLVLLAEARAQMEPTEPCVRGLADLGDCVLLAGAPDAGKTCLAAYVAGCVVTGSPVFGLYECEKRPVVWLAFEEAQGHVTKRFDWIPEESELYIWTPSMEDWRGFARTPVEMIMEHEEGVEPDHLTGSLVVIDPLLAAFVFRDPNNAGEVRTALTPLRCLAQEFGFTCLVIHHMRKGTGGAMSERILGSNQYAAVFPTKWLIEPLAGGSRLRFEASGKFQDPVQHVLTRTRRDAYSVLDEGTAWRRKRKPREILADAAELCRDAKRILMQGPKSTSQLCEELGLSAPYGRRVRAILERYDDFAIEQTSAKSYEIRLR